MRVDGGRLHEDLALNSSNAVNRALCCSSAGARACSSWTTRFDDVDRARRRLIAGLTLAVANT